MAEAPTKSTELCFIQRNEIECCGDHPIGEGARGHVYKRIYKGQYVAVKYSNNSNCDDFLEEARHLCKINHTNIVKFIGYCEEPTALVLEFASNGSLHAAIMNKDFAYGLPEIGRWARQCADGLEAMHVIEPKPLVHRDIKPQNLLLFNDYKVLKICDLDCSRSYCTTMTACRGSASFMAPELLVAEASCRYTCKVDVYSFGITLWQMVARRAPYGDLNECQIMWAVKTRKLRPEALNDCPLYPLMKQCWNSEPNRRPDMTRVKMLLPTAPKQYILLNGDEGQMVVLSADNFDEVSKRRDRTTSACQIAVCNGMLYSIDTHTGRIRSTPVSCLLKAKGQPLLWNECGVFQSSHWTRGTVAVVGHIIYFLSTTHIWKFDTVAKSVTPLHEYGSGYYCYSVVELGDLIYCYKGHRLQVTDRINGWKPIDLPASFGPYPYHCSLLMMENSVCLVGGRGAHGENLTTVLCYDTRTSFWSDGNSINEGRNLAATVALDGGKTLLVGGRRDGKWIDSVELFDDQTKEWNFIDYKVNFKFPQAVKFYA